MKRITFFAILLHYSILLIGQSSVVSTSEQIIIDGKLEEQLWLHQKGDGQFSQYFPSDTTLAGQQSEVYYGTDGKNLFVAIKCYSVGNDYITNSLQRDFSARGSDNFTIVIDPYNEKTNAFVFGINPFGVRREAIISNGGQNPRTDWDVSWDNKWFGEAAIYDGYWTAEFQIPLRILRFRENNTIWRFNAYRFDTQNNEMSTLVHIPRNNTIIDLGFSKELIWDTAPTNSGANISLIPYISAGRYQDFESEPTLNDADFSIGGDVKMAISSSLNLDATINPDFSQVEVDEQVTNLQRFEVFFPERRQFFIENANLFNRFGFSRTNPFFSRRIGIAKDTASNSLPVNILAGAKISGKISKNTQIGILSVQTRADETEFIPSTNYSMLALQQTIKNRNNVSLFMVNKQLDKAITENENQLNTYNRVLGIESNFGSNDNKFTGKVYYHYSISEDRENSNAFSQGARINYVNSRWRLRLTQELVGNNYDAEVGFIPRTGYFRIDPTVEWISNKNKIFNQIRIGFDPSVRWLNEIENKVSDHNYELRVNASANNNSNFRLGISHRYVYLTGGFDPTGTSSLELDADTDYRMVYTTLSYQSDRRKSIFFSANSYIGEYFNGKRFQLRKTIGFRIQPKFVYSLRVEYNHTNLPAPYATASLWLVSNRIEVTFNKKLFWSTFIQYNQQEDNINFNSRVQWRFAPVSDFFIVYSDNYIPNRLQKRNRSIILKATYWLNL